MVSKIKIIDNGQAILHILRGKLHRVAGPAVEYHQSSLSVGSQYWWYKGKYYPSLSEFLKIPDLTDEQRVYIKLMYRC